MHSQELKKIIDNELDKQECLVAFLDILGFKQQVKKYVNPKSAQDKKILENIEYGMQTALKTIRERNNGLDLIQYKIFSDCICVSVPDFYDTQLEATMLCLLIDMIRICSVYLFRWNIYVRGGISVGFHHENNNMIFSEGLIKAHDLEQGKAIYPRTILDEELVERFKKLWINQKNTILDFGIEKKIIIDDKGVVFINPFKIGQSLNPENLENLEEMYANKNDFEYALHNVDYEFHMELLENVEEKIKEFREDKRVLRKYSWLKDLINWNIDPKSSEVKFEYLLKFE